MPHLNPIAWRVFRSDHGRLWATRERVFTGAAQFEGAARTVDGDDHLALARAIAEQESIATLVGCAP
ncbi:hypothetical protein Sru01_24670 [Sphaerisporangium rufum]|uniref:Uncharacterized protein n=1 Tax=Sphaerisporangium rufum TaxID=1381558 RepID=A0A919R340_9ACTN|nr:hypothetical protein [Sphaerisporangium rufum]GII77485.1 hypothetical protein Sru01_24670 [Sphaerisporangium rufum]